MTNDFDDPLEGWDTAAYVPCLRTDDLVLELHEPDTIDRLRRSTGVDVQDLASLRVAIGREIFERLASRGALGLRGQPATGLLHPAAGCAPGGLSHRSAARSRNWICAPTSTRRFAHRCSGCLADSSAPSFELPFDLMIVPALQRSSGGKRRRRSRSFRPPAALACTSTVSCSTTLRTARFSARPWGCMLGPNWLPDSGTCPDVLPMGHGWYSNVPGNTRST